MIRASAQLRDLGYHARSRILPAQKKALASEDEPRVWRANARREDL